MNDFLQKLKKVVQSDSMKAGPNQFPYNKDHLRISL